MNLYDNSANLGKLFQANNLLANLTSLGASPDLTVKKPLAGMPDLGNIQAAYSSASTIESIFGSSRSAANPLMQFTSMMPQMNAMNNFFSPSISAGAASNAGNAGGYFDQSSQIASSMSQTNWMNNLTASSIGLGGLLSMPSMPTVNTGSLGNAPVTMDSFMVGLGVAMGMIDPSTMDAATLSALGLPAPAGASQSAGNSANAIKKMPVMSASSVEIALNKTYTVDGENISFITSDNSGKTMGNSFLSTPEAKREFITNVAGKIDKEVRLAERRDYENIAAETLSEEILNTYIKKHGDTKSAFGATKEQILAGLKKIALKENIYAPQKDIYGVTLNASRLDPDVEAALKVLPSTKQYMEGANYGSDYVGYNPGAIWIGGGVKPEDNPSIKIFQSLTADLSKEMKNKIINKNMSLGA